MSGSRKKKKALYRCDCGEVEERLKDNVPLSNKKVCVKCSNRNKQRPLKKVINGIVVEKDLGMIDKKRYAIFICNCGNKFKGKVNSVLSGQLRSCGCVRGKSNLKHGLTKHPLYRKWSGMITRTTNKNENCYKRYGGKGVKVCDEWRNDFKKFYDWAIENGYRKGLTIDRIDPKGNYEPSNCQWLTMKENTIKDMKGFVVERDNNSVIIGKYVEENKTIRHISKELGIARETISKALKINNIKIEKGRRID